MRDNHVNAFLDLSEGEKAFVLQKATKAVQGGKLPQGTWARMGMGMFVMRKNPKPEDLGVEAGPQQRPQQGIML